LTEDGFELVAEGGFEEPDAVGIFEDEITSGVSVSGAGESC